MGANKTGGGIFEGEDCGRNTVVKEMPEFDEENIKEYLNTLSVRITSTYLSRL